MIYLGADHAGWQLKESLKKHLTKRGVHFTDLGNDFFDPGDDYPDFARTVAKTVAKNGRDRGVLVCGSGIGMCIAANKIKGIRAFIPLSAKHAQFARRHTNVNVICFGGQYTTESEASKMLAAFLKTDFETAARHTRRLKKIE